MSILNTIILLLYFIPFSFAGLITQNLGKKDLKPGFRVRFYKPSLTGDETDDVMKAYLDDKTYETEAEFLGQMNGVTSTEFNYLRGHNDFINGFYIDPSIDQFLVEYRGYFAPSVGGQLGTVWTQYPVDICPGNRLRTHAAAYSLMYNEVFLNNTADKTVCTWETSNRNGGRNIFSGFNNGGAGVAMNTDIMYADQLYPFRLVFFNDAEALEAKFRYYTYPEYVYYSFTEGNSFYSPNDNYEYRDANANAGWSKICPKFDVEDTMTSVSQPPFVTYPYTCPISSSSEEPSSTSEPPITSSSGPPIISSHEPSELSSTGNPESSSIEPPELSSTEIFESSFTETPESSSSDAPTLSSSEPSELSSTYVPESSSIEVSKSSSGTKSSTSVISVSESSALSLESTLIFSSTADNNESIISSESSIAAESTDSSSATPSSMSGYTNDDISSSDTTQIFISSGNTDTNVDISKSETFVSESTTLNMSTLLSTSDVTSPTEIPTEPKTVTYAFSQTSKVTSTDGNQPNNSHEQLSSFGNLETTSQLKDSTTGKEHSPIITTKTLTSCGASCVTSVTTITVEWSGTTNDTGSHQAKSEENAIEQFTTTNNENNYDNNAQITATKSEVMSISVPNHTEMSHNSESIIRSTVASIDQFLNQANTFNIGAVILILIASVLI